MPHSLLLHSLDPKPDRKALEEITASVPSIARADAAVILNDWFGIVCPNLPLGDAQAFQAGLLTLGVGADIVPDIDIPSLHHDFRCQRIDITDGEIVLSTSMGRRYPRQRGDLVFIAAGFLDREKAVSATEMRTEMRVSRSDYGLAPAVYTTQVERNSLKIEEKRFFRIDLFFTGDPHRISLEIDKETVCFYGDRPIRIKNPLDLTVLMVDLQSLLPPERMNRSLRELSTTGIYPSMHAYGEEIRWAFYRLGAKG